MRDIKFRAWTGSNMEYDIIVGKFGAFYINPGTRGDGLSATDTASLTNANTIYAKTIPIMQFTGLKDETGKEIYEGDIIASSYIHFKHNGVGFETTCSSSRKKGCSHLEVFYVNESASFHGITWNDKGEKTSAMGLTQPHIETWTILGNIYENSELLK